MFYRSLFPRDVFSELSRLQREMHQSFDLSPSIRGVSVGGFPAINIGSTPKSVEIYAFDMKLEQGVLTIAGERGSMLPSPEVEATVHIDERFEGRFRRVISLPDDIDANSVQAKYRDGVLHVSIQRSEAAQPRRINIE